MSRKIALLGIIPFFIMCFGFGAFLERENYSAGAFVLVYISLFSLPFCWALPLRENAIYDKTKAILYGSIAVILFGLFHLVHYLAHGSKDTFLIIAPLFAIFTLGGSSTLYTGNAD